jgi:protein O-mannosyl-transferase
MKKTFLFILVLSLFVIMTHSFMVHGSFKTLDDQASIVHNSKIKDLNRSGQLFTSSYFGTNDYYRPLVLFSYALEHHFFGLQASFYYWTNIALHTITSIFVFLIFRHIFQNSILAFAGALLFGIHPIHWEAVSNISGRSILLCSTLVLSSFWFFLLKRNISYVLSLLCFSLALLSKESAVMLPFVIFSYQTFFEKDTWKPRFIFSLLPFFILIGLFFLLRQHLGITQLFYERSILEVLRESLTFLKGLFIYIGLLILPLDLHFDRALAITPRIFNKDTLLGISMLTATILIGWRYGKIIPKAAWFFLIWFILELIPISQIFVFIGIQPGFISLAEHFLYNASIGFIGLLVISGNALYSWSISRKAISPVFIMTLFIIFYASLLTLSITYNLFARNETVMLERTISYNPYNARMRYNLGVIYSKQKRFKEAEENFRFASTLSPQVSVKAKIGLGKALCDQGKFAEGLAVYESIKSPGIYKQLLEENKRLTRELLLKNNSL